MSAGPTNISNSGLSRQAARAYAKCTEQIKRNNANLLEELLDHPRSALYQVCIDNDITRPNGSVVVGTKWVLANSIVAWVRSYASNLISIHLEYRGNISTKKLFKAWRHLIRLSRKSKPKVIRKRLTRHKSKKVVK